MTTIFSTKRNRVSKSNLSKLSKRILGMEALESREMLSVNPLGVDYDAPNFVQTESSQDFQTEAVTGGVLTIASAPHLIT
ncbi:MAG: hypothetical protein LBU34_07635, partial [Planctomycetaceae bacterium]|nr:hypothetical protein [Planctomycetaceae bacterium]